MSDTALIEETALGLLGAPSHEGAFVPETWKRLEDAGLPLVGLPEEYGGSGGSLREAAVVLVAAARAAAMQPLAETALIGGWLFAEAGFDLSSGPLTGCVLDGTLRRSGAGYVLDGRADHVPWGRASSRVAVLVDGAVVRVDPARATVVPGENLAGEPRDALVFERVEVADGDVRETALDVRALRRRGALARSIGIVGAATAAADLTFELVRQREQFGRPLAAFQAVQQMVAALAAELATTIAAVDLAIEVETPTHVAAAKIQAGRGATAIARLAHQLQGAVGMTYESQLHLFTRRLWAWRDEYGSESVWALELGQSIAVRGVASFWASLTDAGIA